LSLAMSDILIYFNQYDRLPSEAAAPECWQFSLALQKAPHDASPGRDPEPELCK